MSHTSWNVDDDVFGINSFFLLVQFGFNKCSAQWASLFSELRRTCFANARMSAFDENVMRLGIHTHGTLFLLMHLGHAFQESLVLSANEFFGSIQNESSPHFRCG